MYIVTFEEKELIGGAYAWVKGHRICDTPKEVEDFLEAMYTWSNDGDFINPQVWYADKSIPFDKKIVIELDKG